MNYFILLSELPEKKLGLMNMAKQNLTAYYYLLYWRETKPLGTRLNA